MDAWKLNSFWKMSAKEFTFNNRRSGTRLAISHLNKFLVSQDLDSKGGRIEAANSIQKFSNHSPLVLSIWGQPIIPNKLSHYFDSSLLEDEKRRVEMLQAWEGELPKTLKRLRVGPLVGSRHQKNIGLQCSINETKASLERSAG
jgi:hypothetical protein